MKQIAATCILVRGDTVLVGWNAKMQGLAFPGGKNEGDETLETTVRREIQEELGLTLGDEVLYLGYVDLPGWLTHVFVAVDHDAQPQVMEPHKFYAFEWLTYAELKQCPRAAESLQKIFAKYQVILCSLLNMPRGEILDVHALPSR